MTVRLILDTDIGSDVDDALALAFAVRHRDIDLAAVTTVADDSVRRAQIARKLLDIAGREDVEVAAGVGWSENPSGRRSWFGHEGEGILEPGEAPRVSERDGVTLLLEETREAATEVATVGMQSNIAAAVERDPGFAPRVRRLHVMGGVFAPIRTGGAVRPPSADHNLAVDPDAALRSLSSGIPKSYVPLDVTVHAALPRTHLDELRSGDSLCRALASLLEVWIRVAEPPDGVAALMHDPLTVACAVDDRFVTSERLPVTVAMHEGAVRTFIDRAAGQEADVVTSVDGPGFADFWLRTVAG